jgi:RHS repeat-associated protein
MVVPRFRSRSSVRTLTATSAVAVVLLGLAASNSAPDGRRDGAPAAGSRVGKPPVGEPPERRVGELPKRRTANSSTRRNANGSYTTSVSQGPLHYQAADGSWRPIEVGLHPVRENGYAWRSGANAFEARFKAAAEPGLLEFRVGGRIVRVSAQGVAPRPARVDGTRVSYPGAYPGADLRYTVTATGVEKMIELAGPDSPTSYTFRLAAADGGTPLTAQPRRDGSYLVNAAPVPFPAFVLDAPVVRESAEAGRVGAPSTDARPQLRVDQQHGDLVVTLSLDEGWLRAAGRRFPVYLDPTITVQPPLLDGSIQTVATATPQTGSHLPIGSYSTGASYRALMQFDLGVIPPGAQVSTAQLGVYFDGSCTDGGQQSKPCGGDHQIDVHRLTSPWRLSTTYSQLSHDPTAIGTYPLTSGSPSGWLTWPVTATVAGWVAGTQPNQGLVLKRHVEGLNTGGPFVSGRLSGTTAPKLDVTYTLTGSYLYEPTTLHANGAELSWARTGSAGYEVHRGASATFTPTASTLLTTTRDPAQTSYRDTTASSGTAFTYKVKDLTTGAVSAGRTVMLPAAGLATKTLQPGPAEGRNTYVYEGSQNFGTFCFNYGGAPTGLVGLDYDQLFDEMISYRTAVYFDLRDIPPGATVSNATMSLWKWTTASAPIVVDAHRITRPWAEGTGTSTNPGSCTGDGATWQETAGGQPWSAPGGDIDPAVEATATAAPATDGTFDQFNLTGLVQSWANGTPNHGVMLRTDDENRWSASRRVVGYATDDFAVASVRPKLTVTYADTSPSAGAWVSVAAPAPGAQVGGTTVPLVAAAEDDRRVERVEFLVDGAVVGTDTAPPFQVAWNSVPGGNGTRQVSARATDDVGHVTTSVPVSVTVDNTAPPSGTLTAPADAATVGATVTLSATASDDVGVAGVAFLVDGVQVGVPDTTSPYSVSWNTLDPLAPVFNGAHQLTAVVTDTSGQQVTTAARSVTVTNLGASPYAAGWVLNDPASSADDVFPTVMAENSDPAAPVQDPTAGSVNPDGTGGGSLGRSLGGAPHDDGGTPPATCPAGAYCPTVRVTNNSGVSWANSTAQVWYRWYAPNTAILFEGRSTGAFPATFVAGASQAFPVTVYPPRLPPGVQQGTYRLRVDVYDPATNTWFAAKGNPPLDNPVLVVKSLATKLGLERFHQYDGEPVGAGMTSLTNVANGNALLRWTPFTAPGRGLATTVDLTYNSLEDHSTSPAGNNFSLSISGLARLGEPIDIHPNKADEISGQANKWVELTDGDGSTHRFTGTTGTDGITRWQEPPGVNLYLRSLAAGDAKGRWAFTRPDKVTFYFDVDGFPTMVEDRNGNRITYTLQDTPPGEDPGGPKKRVTAVTDAGGRSFGIDYWSKDEAKKAHVRGKIQTITDHSGSALDFFYYEDGNLRRITQRGGTQANGQFLADRSFVFTYTTSNGSGPAIPDPADRVDPQPRTPNQSTLLYSVRDPRGAETTYAYYLPSDGPQLRWKLRSRTNRAAQATSYGYDLTNRVATVTAPLSRVTRFTYDVTGKTTRIVDPNNQPTDVEWSPDFKVTKVTEPTGRFTSYSYNANGYLLGRTNQAGERTELTYLDQPVDGNDSGNHLSLLSTVTTPRGVATPSVPNDFRWQYTYDGAGNVDRVTDPTGATTDYDVNLAGSASPGTLAAIHDAKGDPPTTFPAYDPSGQPTQIVDPLGQTTRIGYDVDGLLRWVQDPNHAGDTGADERAFKTFFDYDSFGRLGRQSAPKSTVFERGTLLWSGTTRDPNDNIVRAMAPHFGPDTGDPETGPVTTTTFDAMDRPLLVTGPDTSADPAGERTSYGYDAAGRLAKLTKPKGVQTTSAVDDFTTVFTYDPLDRILRTTEYGLSTAAAETRTTHSCYDLAGDLRSTTSPRAGLASVACPGDGPAAVAFTTTMSYDNAHRLTSRRDPLGHETRFGYDLNGNRTSQGQDITTGRATRTETEFDQRDAPVLIRERLDGATGRNVTTRLEYDANGNRSRVVSPRGSDAGGTGPYSQYVTEASYDALNRPTRLTLPFDSADGTERQYVHNSYDPNGNLLWTSLPVTSASPGAVADTARTVLTYFDTGWIRTSDEPSTPRVHFDYTAFGLQSQRTPEKSATSGELDPSLRMTWQYYPDGLPSVRTDQGGQQSTYRYDAHNLLVVANDADGVTQPGEKPVDLQATYTGFDEVAKTRFRRTGETLWTFSDYTYDANGNVTVRRENGQENDLGQQTRAPRRNELSYDAADWLATQLDLGVDSACTDDQRIVTTFWSTGWEKQRDTYRADAGCSADPATWPKKQTRTWTHFDNRLLRQLETRNGAGTVTESHQIGYVTPAGVYLNGNRVSDRYVLQRGEGSTATTCLAASPCDAAWQYDARDRLVSHQQRAGMTTSYALDQPAQLLGDQSIRAGNVTTETRNGVATTRRYRANQLTEATTAGTTVRYWYDPLGDLDCVTTAAGTAANCSPPDGAGSAELVTDYAYDYLRRLTLTRQYAGGQNSTDRSEYVYDALDRPVTEIEDHAGTGRDRTTSFTHLGLTNLVTEERQTGGAAPKTKAYSYDAYGHRISLTDTDNTTGAVDTYTYGQDVHGSISQLLTDAGAVKASYGYDAYGSADAPATDAQALTKGDTDSQAPLNPYRYAGKRLDSGQATSANSGASYQMGVRRYGPDIGRFLQADVFAGALADLGLSLDPLTQNRYALAGGNPVSFIELDGHRALADGGGGGSPAPAPTPSPLPQVDSCAILCTVLPTARPQPPAPKPNLDAIIAPLLTPEGGHPVSPQEAEASRREADRQKAELDAQIARDRENARCSASFWCTFGTGAKAFGDDISQGVAEYSVNQSLALIGATAWTLGKTSQATGVSLGICAGGSAHGTAGVTGSACIVGTPDGDSGIIVNAGGGGGLPSYNGLLGISISNAQKVSDYGGPFASVSAGGGVGVNSWGGSFSIGRNDEGRTIWQGVAGWTPGVGLLPVSFSVDVTNTWILPYP